MEHLSYSRDAELVIGIVAPVGVNMDGVQNRLASLFTQFRYTVNFIHVSQLAKGYVDQHAEAVSELQRLDEAMNNGRDIRKRYGRAVHAEMEAILSAGRNGVPVRNATLYSTTYPCHNCAKHIVACGIATVKYIEPYPKSHATRLHDDAIDAQGEGEQAKVQFESFVGIGPRRFVDLFSMSLSRGGNIGRKANGSLIEWQRGQARPRVPLNPLSYLEAEDVAVLELAKTKKGV